MEEKRAYLDNARRSLPWELVTRETSQGLLRDPRFMFLDNEEKELGNASRRICYGDTNRYE